MGVDCLQHIISKQAPYLMDEGQQDAQELLSFLLSSMDQELVEDARKSTAAR